MNDLLRTKLFGLLTETSLTVTNKEMENAYRQFIVQIEAVSNGSDYSTIYRIFTATRIELASLEASSLYGQGKKCA